MPFEIEPTRTADEWIDFGVEHELIERREIGDMELLRVSDLGLEFLAFLAALKAAEKAYGISEGELN